MEQRTRLVDMTNNHNNRHNTEGTRDHLSPLQGTVAGISVIKAGVRRPPFSVAYENIIFFIRQEGYFRGSRGKKFDF